MKRVAILQSNYIPWKGYFEMINMVDEFIFHDDLQYTKNDWRNRNLIKTSNGAKWLTIPCGTNEKRLICEVELNDKSWQRKHWNQIVNNYRKAKYFKDYYKIFEEIYLNKSWDNLSELNQYLIKFISREILNIKTKFLDSRDYNLKFKKSERVLEILLKVNANVYLSGYSAKNYLKLQDFIDNEIHIEWMDYTGYLEYNQLFPPFEHAVSILDLIFNEGENAKKYLKSF
ncbi:MAG: WbqC family protein [Bacteroidales bacterium]|nr:WbqC family protein [Bacteroidales bacterium]MBN2757952.1 WbqC family protein [Bacteroidales bacterium]